MTVDHFMTKTDMSGWTRGHSGARVITWSVVPGPGGTMVVADHGRRRPEVRDCVAGGPAIIPSPVRAWAAPVPAGIGGAL